MMRLAHLAFGFVATAAENAQDLIGMLEKVRDAGVIQRHRHGI